MLNDQTIDATAVANSAKRANSAPLERSTAPRQTKTGKSARAIARATGPQSRSMTAVLPIMGVLWLAVQIVAKIYQLKHRK